MTVTTYSVTCTRGCRVIEGAVPIRDLVALIKAWTDGAEQGSAAWFFDSLLSQHLHVNVVCGPQHATDAWRDELGLNAPTL